MKTARLQKELVQLRTAVAKAAAAAVAGRQKAEASHDGHRKAKQAVRDARKSAKAARKAWHRDRDALRRIEGGAAALAKRLSKLEARVGKGTAKPAPKARKTPKATKSVKSAK